MDWYWLYVSMLHNLYSESGIRVGSKCEIVWSLRRTVVRDTLPHVLLVALHYSECALVRVFFCGDSSSCSWLHVAVPVEVLHSGLTLSVLFASYWSFTRHDFWNKSLCMSLPLAIVFQEFRAWSFAFVETNIYGHHTWPYHEIRNMLPLSRYYLHTCISFLALPLLF